jgi:hypothetical protein
MVNFEIPVWTIPSHPVMYIRVMCTLRGVNG